MSQTFNLGGLGDNKLTKLIFSNGTANTCSIFLNNDGYLVFEQGANTVTFPLGELPVDKRLAIENGIVVEGRDVVDTGTVGGDNQNNLVVDGITEDALVSAVADALGVENLFSAKSEPQAGDGVYPGFANAMLFDGNYLYRNQRAGTRNKMTYSLWVKRNDANQGHLLYVGNASNAESSLYFIDSRLQIEYYHGAGASYNKRIINQTTDTSSWYHVVFFIDTNNPTDDHKFRIYVNSVEGVTDVQSTLQNLDMDFNKDGSTVYIGARTGSHTNFKGYLANIQFIDGQALDPSYFGQYLQLDGEETNIWIPKPLDSSIDYGPNGFYLDFSRNTLSGNDITVVHDVAPLTGTHTQPNDWTAN